MELDIERITKEAINEVVRRTVMGVIARETGSALESEVKDAIKVEARRLCETDPEIKQAIRDAVIFWIRKQ